MPWALRKLNLETGTYSFWVSNFTILVGRNSRSAETRDWCCLLRRCHAGRVTRIGLTRRLLLQRRRWLPWRPQLHRTATTKPKRVHAWRALDFWPLHTYSLDLVHRHRRSGTV